MEANQPAFKAYNKQCSGVQARGQPRGRWIDGVAETLQFHVLSDTEPKHKALGHRRW